MTASASALRPLRGLRLDLCARSARDEHLSGEVARAFLGGRGLGAYLALRERLYEVEPLAAENLLIFAPGPLTASISRQLSLSRRTRCAEIIIPALARCTASSRAASRWRVS